MKKILLVLTLLGFSALCVNAEELTVDESIQRDYLGNHGYSDSFVDLIEHSRARADSYEYVETENPEYEKTYVKWARKFFMYLDPGLDNGTFMNHDAQPQTSINDL